MVAAWLVAMKASGLLMRVSRISPGFSLALPQPARMVSTNGAGLVTKVIICLRLP